MIINMGHSSMPTTGFLPPIKEASEIYRKGPRRISLVHEKQLKEYRHYKRFSVALQEREYEDRKAFIDEHPLFRSWAPRFKRLLEMSLIKETHAFDAPIVKQGDHLDGLKFLRRGRAKVLVEPNRHPTQYPNMVPFKFTNNVFEIELNRKPKPVDSARSSSERVESVRQNHVLVKRKEGYAAAEKLQLQRSILLCTVEDGEVIGDVETVMGMNQHMVTIISTTPTEVYSLTSKNFDRLVMKKNQVLLDLLQKHVVTKLTSRVDSVQGAFVPLLRHILFKLTEEIKPVARKPIPALQGTKSLPEKDVLFEHQMEMFSKNKAEMLEPYVPGAIYYREIMREKATMRENIRKRKKAFDQIRRRRKGPRLEPRPRTIVALRAALQKVSEVAEERERRRIVTMLREKHREEMLNEFIAQERALQTSLSQRFNQAMTPQAKVENGTAQEGNANTDAQRTEVTDAQNDPAEKPSIPYSPSKLTKQKDRSYMKSQEENQKDIGHQFESLSDPEISPSKDFGDKIETKSDTAEEKYPGVHPVAASFFPPVRDAAPKEERTEFEDRLGLIPRGNEYLRVEPIDDPDYRDWETSDGTLRYLEERIGSFVKKTRRTKSRGKGDPVKLKRFEAGVSAHSEEEELKQPKPGGKVMVHRTRCKYAESKYQSANHSHVTYNMVPQLNDYPTLKKARMLAHMRFDRTRNKSAAQTQEAL